MVDIDPFERGTWTQVAEEQETARMQAQQEDARQQAIEACRTQAQMLLVFLDALMEGGHLTRPEALTLAAAVWRVQ